MPKAILMEEFHITVFAPRGLPELEYQAMHRTLNTQRWHRQLRSAVRMVVRKFPTLGKVRVVVTQ